MQQQASCWAGIGPTVAHCHLSLGYLTEDYMSAVYNSYGFDKEATCLSALGDTEVGCKVGLRGAFGRCPPLSLGCHRHQNLLKIVFKVGRLIRQSMYIRS